jgi:hypothetical protein
VDNLKREVIHLRRLLLALAGNFGSVFLGVCFAKEGRSAPLLVLMARMI